MAEMKFRGVMVDYIDVPANPEKGFNPNIKMFK